MVECWLEFVGCGGRWLVVGCRLSSVGYWLSVSVVAQFSHCLCPALLQGNSSSSGILSELHCKKGYRHSRQKPGCHSPNSPWARIIKLFPPREILVSDIPGWGREGRQTFLRCVCLSFAQTLPAIFDNKSAQQFRFGCRPVCIAGAIIAWAGISASTISGSI